MRRARPPVDASGAPRAFMVNVSIEPGSPLYERLAPTKGLPPRTERLIELAVLGLAASQGRAVLPPPAAAVPPHASLPMATPAALTVSVPKAGSLTPPATAVPPAPPAVSAQSPPGPAPALRPPQEESAPQATPRRPLRRMLAGLD